MLAGWKSLNHGCHFHTGTNTHTVIYTEIVCDVMTNCDIIIIIPMTMFIVLSS